MSDDHKGTISISDLLKRLLTPNADKNVKAEEIAAALALVFTNNIDPIQLGLLLGQLHVTEGDYHPKVLTACSEVMREAAAHVDDSALQKVIQQRSRPEGAYHGGLCDIVGTGGDGHNTFNVSTTSSIIASGLLMIAKHGNGSSTSISGSADLLQHYAFPRGPIIKATTHETLPKIYEKTNYAFLYAQQFHPGAKYAAPVRKQLPVRTIFNLLGPLANPVHEHVECRILGVARKDIGMNFAEALRNSGAKKAMVVCGDENLDEISCAGPTHCWHIHSDADAEEATITSFQVSPSDFGLPSHSLEEVHGGKGPTENAEILSRILRNELRRDHPVLHFVLMNVAALITVAGVCEADESAMGSGDDGEVIKERGSGGLRWKEGVRRARWCLESGAALEQWEAFVEVTNQLGV